MIPPTLLYEIEDALPLSGAFERLGHTLTPIGAGLWRTRCHRCRRETLLVAESLVAHDWYWCRGSAVGSSDRGCESRGGLIGLWMTAKNIGYRRAVEELAELAEIPIGEVA